MHFNIKTRGEHVTGGLFVYRWYSIMGRFLMRLVPGMAGVPVEALAIEIIRDRDQSTCLDQVTNDVQV